MNKNPTQDPEYEGLPYHEKKLHKTHFGVLRTLKKRKHPKDDPEWEYVGVGRWRWVGNSKKRDNAGEKPEEQ